MHTDDQNALPTIDDEYNGLEDRSEELGGRSEADAQIRFYRAMASVGVAYEDVLQTLARAVAEVVFDLCAIHLVTDDGKWIELRAVFHPNPTILGEIQKMYASSPQAVDEGIFGQVIGTQSAYFQPHWSRRRQTHDTKPEYRKATTRLRIHSLIVAPLITTDKKVIGTLTVGRHNTMASYDRTDLALLEWIATHAAMKVETARLYRDLRQTNAELDNAVRARDRFISIAAHELRTPLTVTKLVFDQLERTLQIHDFGPDVDSMLAPGIRRLDRQMNDLTDLINRMLDVSRLCDDRLEPQYEPIDLCQVIEEAVEDLHEILHQARCEVILDLDGPQEGNWDRDRLHQILHNLLTNAARYAAPSPIFITLTARADTVYLTIRDEGPGIAPSDQRRIFERFERIMGHKKSSGMGLGLWIVRRCAESMGGEIGVESQPGKGAAFTVVLPRQAPPT